MRLKTIFIFLLNLSVGFWVYGQDYVAQFKTLQNDTAAQAKLLIDWEKAKPEDAELYVAYLNFWVMKSMHEVLNLNPAQKGENSFQITDPKTGKVVAYINDGVTYDRTLVEKGFHYIDIGIKKFPTRLDMRFGKIYMLDKIYAYDKFTSELIAVIEYGQKIDSKWTWSGNAPVDDPLKFMLGAEQDYIRQLYAAGNAQIPNMKAIAETVLKYYPDNVENLSNLAITYILKKDYAKALEPLLKATSIAPTDGIVVNNIAYCYNAQNDKANAIKYYELAAKYGDKQTKQSAEEKLKQLNKQ